MNNSGSGLIAILVALVVLILAAALFLVSGIIFGAAMVGVGWQVLKASGRGR